MLAVWASVDQRLLSLDESFSDMGQWDREDWKDLVRVLHSPLAREIFGLSSSQRRAEVGGRMARLAHQISDDPLRLAAVTAGEEVFTFRGAGLALTEENTGLLFIIKRGDFIRIGGGPLFAA